MCIRDRLPEAATELQHLISYKDMNAQIGEIFRACYRYGEVAHSEKLRDAKKIKFYADAEVERLEALELRMNVPRASQPLEPPLPSYIIMPPGRDYKRLIPEGWNVVISESRIAKEVRVGDRIPIHLIVPPHPTKSE